jgi:putative SOS response-associated peptidase YedK
LEIRDGKIKFLASDNHDSWLTGNAGKEILVPYPPELMTDWPISTRVNSPRNNDPAIVDPMEILEK